ncbi:MAG: MFS transporter [Porticoccaceae bacterium]|jgi:MFS family permease|nr:MFS transporter [Porticoccaceae bacterium]MEA3298808.1 MFS transporter [Pseudomonadota bacterium]HLS99020.1 MFS transporter [Porticoccaceae bacterium]
MRLDYRWQVLAFALVMQILVIGVGVYCFTFFVVHWVEEFQVPRGELMLGYMGMTLMAGLLAPFSGILIDRFQRRWVITAGVLAYTLGLLAVVAAPTAIAIILIFWVLMPLGMGLAGPLMAQTLVAQAFDSKRGMALGICALGTSLGGLIMPVVATAMLAEMAWRPVLASLAVAISVVILPMAFLIVRARPAAAPQADSRPAIGTRALLGNRDIYLLGICYLIPGGLFVAVLQNLGLQAQDLGIPQQQAGLIVGGASLLMAGGKFISGSLADRISHHGIYYTLLALAALGLLGVATADSFLPFAAGVLLLGATAGGVSPLIGTTAAHRFGIANFARAMGIIMGFGSLSGTMPFVAGWLRDFTGSYETAYLAILPLALPAVICFSRLKKAAEA